MIVLSFLRKSTGVSFGRAILIKIALSSFPSQAVSADISSAALLTTQFVSFLQCLRFV